METHQSLSLRERRLSQGLTRAALAALVGVSARQIARYEDGDQSPTLPVAERLADALGVTLDTLAGRNGA